MPENQFLDFIERVTTPRRFQHSLGVMRVMGELAGVYNLDRELAQTIGLLHDAGKDLSAETQEQLVAEGKIETYFDCDRDYVLYFHGPVGAYFVQKELGMTDRLVLDAIRTHTFYGDGEHFHHPLVWCLRFSDLLEPTRSWTQWKWFQTGVENLRRLVYAGHLTEGAFLQSSMQVRWLGEQGFPVHPNIIRSSHEFAVQLNLDATYVERHTA